MFRPLLKTRAVTLETPDGVTISVQEWGNPSGPEIVFIHGISQSYLSWQKQIESELADSFRLITYDLRGHGGSAKPLDGRYYRESERWARELHCVIEGLSLNRPVLVGWSYAGRIVADYLLSYGDSSIAGINFVSATTKVSADWASRAGDLLVAMTSDDLATNIQSTKAFLRLCTCHPLQRDEFETMLAFNMTTPAKVRGFMLGRPAPYDELLRKLRVPVLVTHGEQDEAVLPPAGLYTASVVPNAAASFYPGVGHMPFWEDAPRFNRELRAFASSSGTFNSAK